MFLWFLQAVFSAIIGLSIPVLYKRIKGTMSNKNGKSDVVKVGTLPAESKSDYFWTFVGFFIIGLLLFTIGIIVIFTKPIETHNDIAFIQFISSGFNDKLLSVGCFMFAFMAFGNIFLLVYFSILRWPNTPTNKTTKKTGKNKT